MEPLSFDENMSDKAESVLSQPFKLSEMDFRQINQLDPYR